MANWSAVLLSAAILVAWLGFSGVMAIPFGLAVALSLGGFLLGVALLFLGPRPPT
ncbi:MAG: hypothetical protein WDA10_08900 [Porticoccaceae bacterium]|jgi:hypothetical protein|nr:hypothetical protein [Porticoccaceae bacterium]MEA3301162.1 hypothetical protein [Pseudomonadota bacterium]HLS99474.1 hypothetical protein [Porticoccaceae bacterium]